jgi:ABC-type microcin C transport system permease subunit YejE
MLNSANIATIQSNRIPLYGSVLNHIETYFQLIKENYLQSFYDQLWPHFSNTGSYYVDSLNANEWHIYGSSRLGVYQRQINYARINPVYSSRRVKGIRGFK